MVLFNVPCGEHAVMLSVQLASNDLVVGAHPLLDSSCHDILRDSPFKGLQVMMEDTEIKDGEKSPQYSQHST